MNLKVSSLIATTVFLVTLSAQAQRVNVPASAVDTVPEFICTTEVAGNSYINADSGVSYTENDPPYDVLKTVSTGDCSSGGKSNQAGTSPYGSSMLASASAQASNTWTVANGSFQFAGSVQFEGSAITNSANLDPTGNPLYEFAVADYQDVTSSTQTTVSWTQGERFTFQVLCFGFYVTCSVSDGGALPLFSGTGTQLYSGTSAALGDASTLSVQTAYATNGKAESGEGSSDGVPSQSTSVDALGGFLFTISPVSRPPGQGGGGADYASVLGAEMSGFNGAPKGALFAANVPIPSQVGLTGFFNNDYSCDENNVSGVNGGACSGTIGGPATVHYAESDMPLSSAQISAWATSPVGQPAAGNLIQIPVMGFGVAIPIVNAAITANGGVALSDHDLCGIFSGKITDFKLITDAGNLTPGPITVAYDSGISGVTLALTNHLAEVCTPADSAITFSATSDFASLFGTVPSNFSGSSGTAGVANYLAGLSGTTVTSAVGYVTPVYTSLIANNEVALSNGQVSPLLVASVFRGKSAELPTEANIEAGLNAPKTGTNLTPPNNAVDAGNPALWASSVAVTKAGYPIVGYTYFVVAACYAQQSVTHAVVSFLKDHFNNVEFRNIQIAHGFAPLPNGAATGKWRTIVVDNLLENTNGWDINIGNATACSGLAGR